MSTLDDQELDRILRRVYVEVPELPNRIIGLSNNMIAELKHELIRFMSEHVYREVTSKLESYRGKK